MFAIHVLGLGLWGLGFEVQGSGFRVSGLERRFGGRRISVWGLGLSGCKV